MLFRELSSVGVQVCFTFECPDWEKVREDEKMGFIMSEWGLEGASLRLVGHGGHGTEGSRLSFPEEEPPCDALLLLELRAVWFNFAAPPRTTNSHRADFTRLDWHLLSTMTPSINAWLKPCDRLLVALRRARQAEQRRLCAVLAWLMAEAMDAQGGHLPPRGKQLYGCLSPLARALQDEPSCQLLSALCRFLAEGAPSPASSLRPECLPPLGTLRRGLLALSRQWKHLLYMPLLVDHNARLRRANRPGAPPVTRVPPREEEEAAPDEAETACLLAQDGAAGQSPQRALRGSRHSLATWSFSSVEPILRSSLDPANDDEDLYNWMARQRGPPSPLDSPGAPPRESGAPPGGIPDAQAVFEPLLSALGACASAGQAPGPRLALSALVELLRVDLVESEGPDQGPRRRSKPGQRLFVDTSTDTPALVCDRLTLELDVRHPGTPRTCAHLAVDVQYVAQQESLAAGAGRAPEVEDTPRCWKTMCFLLDLYESMPPSKALADRFTVTVGTEHKCDASEGYRAGTQGRTEGRGRP
ncbi:hypothetical protein IscW_ISCW000089 [Ixodes scapularis]|uniref:Bridge-like lipid transfer protein family member 1 middle region domain-containing protein n=1 Tax=Ixodes scapularis TaxID=6945 RepID=B7P0N1_IXOSC|nr:hypothetical protein IscW_ISCW000089 [Ixodes scapularis]|eukprot:XP_002399299.1 hypothetical protein IscW_ISCW000089 [Ixodes scapularis]